MMAVSAVVVIIFLSVLLIQKQGSEKVPVTNNPENVEPVATQNGKCQLADDQAYFDEAVNKPDMDLCGCIKEYAVGQACKGASGQATLNQQAIEQLDERICDEILDPAHKENCRSVVVGKIEHMQDQNKEGLAYTYINNNNNEKAIAILQEMISEDPEDTQALINIALAYSNQAIYDSLDDKEKASNIDEALASIKKAQAIEPDNSETYRMEAFIYESADKLPQAMVAYEKAIEMFPNDVALLSGLGHVESMAGYIKKAMETFELAAKLDTKLEYPAPWANLCRLQAGDSSLHTKALETCQKVIDMEAANANSRSEAYQIMAQILVMQGEIDLALDKLQQAIAMAPTNDNVYVSLASAYSKKNDWVSAEEMANKALKINGAKTAAHLELAKALYGQKKLVEALVSVERGLAGLESDVSVLLPSKPRIEMELDYLASKIHSEKGDERNAEKYKTEGDELAKMLNISLE